MPNILVIFLVCYSGTILCNIVYVLLQSALAPTFLFRISAYKIFGFHFERSPEGKFKYIKRKGFLSILAFPTLDPERTKDVPHEKITRNENMYLLLCANISIVIFVIPCVIGFFNNAPLLLMALFATGAFMAILKLAVTIYAMVLATSKSSVARYSGELAHRVRTGTSFKDLNVKSLAELGAVDAKIYEKINYIQFYAYYLEENERFEELDAFISEYEPVIRNLPDIRAYLGVRLMLLHYYSAVKITPDKADEYYAFLKPLIEKDQDANSFRIRGYYELNIHHDKPKARELAIKANEVVDSFSIGGERAREKALIDRLLELTLDIDY